MAEYNLFITSSDGKRTFKSLRSPYAQREDARRTVQMVVANHLREPTPDVDREFAETVLAAPLGETIVHEPSGVAFRTEET